jgi:hypothetical protein
MDKSLGPRHYIWGFFLIISIVSTIFTFATGGFKNPDCSLPSNSQEIQCLPDEEFDQPTGGFDPNRPGEPYDGGDFPAP